MADMPHIKLLEWLCVGSCAVLLLIFVSLYNGLYGQDAHEYYLMARQYMDSLKNGQPPGSHFYSPAYPFWGAMLGMITGLPIALQLLSIAFYILSLYWAASFIKTIFSHYYPWHLFYVLIMIGLSPYFMRSGYSIMTDTPASALALGGFYYGYRTYNGEWRMAVASMLCITLSLSVRQQLFPLLAPTALLVAFSLLRDKKIGWLVFSMLVSLPVLMPLYLYGEGTASRLLENSYLNNWRIANFFLLHTEADGESFRHPIPNVVFYFLNMLRPELFGSGILLFLFIRIKNYAHTYTRWMLLSIILYLLFICGMGFQNYRMLFPVFPLIMVILYPSFEILIDSLLLLCIPQRIGGTALLLLHSLLCIMAFRPFYNYQKEEKAITAAISRDHSQPVIYTVGYEGPLHSYTSKKIISLWTKTPFIIEKNALLLYDPLSLKKQFKDSPEANAIMKMLRDTEWNFLRKFDNGFELYETH